MSKSTPAPWRVKNQYDVIASDRDWPTIANCGPQGGFDLVEACKANARLIAASPDLLASCVEQAALIKGLRNLLTFYRCGKRPTEKVLDSVQDPSGIQERAAAAIKKATE